MNLCVADRISSKPLLHQEAMKLLRRTCQVDLKTVGEFVCEANVWRRFFLGGYHHSIYRHILGSILAQINWLMHWMFYDIYGAFLWTL